MARINSTFRFRVSEFPNCCALRILSRFGNDGDNLLLSEKEDALDDEDTFKMVLKRTVNHHKENLCYIMTIIAVTNNEQKTANKVLKEFGFVQTELRYLNLWFIDSNDLINRCK